MSQESVHQIDILPTEVEDLIPKDDDLNIRLDFGKHKGEKLKDIPTDYLQWVLDIVGNAQSVRLRPIIRCIIANRSRPHPTWHSEEETLVTISRDGYIKRLPIDTYRTQKRGGRGVQAENLKEEDQLAHLFVATTTHYILFFTNRGRIYRLNVYDIPESSITTRGQHINDFIQSNSGERITAILPIKDFKMGGYLVMATEYGEIKRTALENFANLRANGLIAFDIEEGDNLNWVKHTDGVQEIMMVTAEGMSIRFKEEDVPERSRGAGGVRGIELRDPKTKIVADSVVAMDVVSPTSQLLVSSEYGFGKRTDLGKHRSQGRGGRGILTMKVTPKTGKIVGAAVVEPEDRLMVLTEHGIVIRIGVKFIRETSRSTQGVKLINLKDGDRVVTIERLISTEEVEERANEQAK